MGMFRSHGDYKSPISPWAVIIMTVAGLATIALLVTVFWLRSGKSGWFEPRPTEPTPNHQKVLSQWL